MTLLSLSVVLSCHKEPSPPITYQDTGAPEGGSPPGPLRLRSCAPDEPVFTALPHALADLRSVSPLGHLAPSPHTFPTDHVYFGFNGIAGSVPLVSPGDLTVVHVSSTEYLSAEPPYSDFAITLRPCQEFEIYFAHVKTLDGSFLAKLGGMDPTFCMSYESGGRSIRYCDQPTSFSIAVGEAIGFGGPDFGAKDARVPALAYANPSNNAANSDGVDSLHAVCPFDYFRDDLKTTLKSMIGDVTGVRLATEPWCGAVMQDVLGSAAGRWFAPGVKRPGQDDPNLALVRDYDWSPTREVFSVGTSASASGLSTGVYFFHPAATGKINRDFKDVKADGTVYCYEQFSAVVSKGVEEAMALQTILIQLTSETKLRIERRQEPACDAMPAWTFDEKATDFER